MLRMKKIPTWKKNALWTEKNKSTSAIRNFKDETAKKRYFSCVKASWLIELKQKIILCRTARWFYCQPIKTQN